jgi:putative membrane-bound dehydrogenase-like protein
MMMSLSVIVVLAMLAADEEIPPPLSPSEALLTLRLKPGMKVELVASEPLIESPVAIDFGADGRLWVCEMRDYPTGIDGRWTPGGVIKVLEDRDGDGRYEHATRLLEGLPFPTGVMAWRRGALVCAAPEIIYAEDRDGDGKADFRQVLFRGFATENYQARVNGLAYGLDNWVYGANGLIGGLIRGTATGRDINIGSRDFRIGPDTGAMEPASGLTQQGRVRDDWGEQFGGNNSIWIQHYPLPDHYVRRNPRVAAPAPAVYIPRDPENQRVYPASRTLERFNQPQSANRVTSACSPLIYRDLLLGPGYDGNAFICEPVHNLVHREVLSADGVTFAGHRADDELGSEFLASTDNWFRPVQVRTGPDGALWVVDMYRYVIEHPRWISPERLAGLDVRAGADRGRIYRVFAQTAPPRPVPNLDRLASADLAQSLDTPNGTLRDNVQRLLVHRGDRAAVPVLESLANRSMLAQTRMQSLCTLDGLAALTPALVRTALADRHPGVRRQAIRLSEPWLGKDEELARAVLALEQDVTSPVRFQFALSLGQWSDGRAGAALGRLAMRDASDPWIRAAVLSSATPHAAAILAAVTASGAPPAARRTLVEPLIASLAPDQTQALAAAVVSLTQHDADGTTVAPWRLSALASLLDAHPGLAGADTGASRFLVAFRSARALAGNAHAAIDDRVAAIALLGRDAARRGDDIVLLGRLLDPQSPVEVQHAAVGALGRLSDPPAIAAMLAAWPRLGPVIRGALLDVLLARQGSVEALLAAVDRGAVPAATIDAAHRQRLAGHRSEAIGSRAAALFATARPDTRQKVIDAYRPALSAPGDPTRGQAVFGRVCAACHRMRGQGYEIGPDLAALTDRSPEALVTAILDPNREVDARYVSYSVARKDGRVASGMIAAETASAITLKREQGQTDLVLRDDIEELASAGRSLMPEGLENDLKPAELADLVAYLIEGAERPKVIPGNHPETVRQAGDGAIRLDAATAALFGPTLTYEAARGNLGSWHSGDDRALWSFQVATPATFTITLEWACADEAAGNSFELQVGSRTHRSTVGATGSWSRYQSIFVGEATLQAGTHRLEIRPGGVTRGALCDLRAVVLTPRTIKVYNDAKPR